MQTLDKEYKYFHLALLVLIVATLACIIVMFVNHKLYLLDGVSENLTFALMIATLLIASSLYFLRKIVICTGNFNKSGKVDDVSKPMAILYIISPCILFCLFNFLSHNILLGILFLLIIVTLFSYCGLLIDSEYEMNFKEGLTNLFYINHRAYFKYIDSYIVNLKKIVEGNNSLSFKLKCQLYYCLHQAVISKHTSFKHIAALSNIIDAYMKNQNGTAHGSYDLICASELQKIKKFNNEFNQIKDDNNFQNLAPTQKKQILEFLLREMKTSQCSDKQNSIKYIGFLKRISEKISEKIHQRFYSKFAKGFPITGAEDADAIIYGYVVQEDQNKPNNNDDLNNKLQEIKNTTPIPSEVLDKAYRNENISESDWSKFDRSVATKAAKLQASIS